MAIDRKRRIRLVSGKHLIHRLARDPQRGIVERALGKHRRITRRVQQQLRSRSGTSSRSARRSTISRLGCERRSQKAEMARGDFRIQRQFELAQAPPLAPFAQQIADRSDGD